MIRLYFDTPEQPGEPAILKGCVPSLESVSWLNEVKSSLINRDLAYVYGSPWGEKRVILGTLPAGRKGFMVRASMPEPALCLGIALKEKLESAGISFDGIVRMSSEPVTFHLVAEVLSPELADIVRIVNHESVNLFAEHLILEIARNSSVSGSLNKGIDAIHHFWKEHGIRDTFFLEDGSGLSRFNAVSASHLTHVLHYMHQSRSGTLFRSSLPLAGEGTLSNFSIHDFPGNSLSCKSGSMNRVRGYAGYLVCDSGREVAFAMLCNNFPLTQAEMVRKMQKLILGMKREF
jgi:D-alanyl-D-alanine carboxypeptidase/D-alanyl-D-alanine-endopeptidase (penicillin-binding protein 4)